MSDETKGMNDAPECDRLQVIEDVPRGAEVTLSVQGARADYVASARLDSGPESRTFSQETLAEGDARFTVRRDFYVLTFVLQFLSQDESSALLGIDFGQQPPPRVRCKVSGKRGDLPRVITFDLETR